MGGRCSRLYHFRERAMTSSATVSDSRPYWDGFERGELWLPYCSDCGTPHLPAGPVCPFCLSSKLDWRLASGNAKLSTWVVERKKWFKTFDPPYIVGEVQLEEGPRMPVQIALTHLDELRMDLMGSIAFYRAPNGLMLPQFEPCSPPVTK
jgi:uncharacterized protein